MKIIFDRSIFHGNNFDKLQQSKIKELVDKRSIKVYFNTAFWEETLRLAAKDKSKLKEQLLFLLCIDTGNWFRPIENIIDFEIRQTEPFPNDYFMFSAEEIVLKQKYFLDIAHGKIDISKAIADYENNVWPKMNKRRCVIKNYCKNNNQSYQNFNDFFHKEKTYFLNQIKARHKINYEIEKNISNYPLTESYLKAYMTCYYVPLNNKKIGDDRNNRMDAEQLAFLIFSDIMVSEDTKFMKEAFSLLYDSTDKKLLTCDQFLGLMSNLNK